MSYMLRYILLCKNFVFFVWDRLMTETKPLMLGHVRWCEISCFYQTETWPEVPSVPISIEFR